MIARMHRTALSFIDLVIVLFLVSFALAFGAAEVASIDDAAVRVHCANNLRQIWQGVIHYSNDNRGAFPRAIKSPDANPVPVWGTPYAKNKDLGPGTSEKPDEQPDTFVAEPK